MDNYQKRIKAFTRKSFKEKKEKENQNKTITDILELKYTKNFTIEEYSNKGDSGQLLLAKSKKEKDEKYILKHEYSDCACNEYIYYKIAEEMKISVVPTKLFIVNDKIKKFKTDFVSGTKYLENSERITDSNFLKLKTSIENWQDYYRLQGLYALFEESDSFEILKYENKIYRIDTTAAFNISDMYIDNLAIDYEYQNINIKEFMKNQLIKLAQSSPDRRINDWTMKKNIFVKQYGEKYLNDFLYAFILLESIKDEDINKWLNVLTYIYPNSIAVYYKTYISNLKKDTKEFLNTIKN